MTTGRAPEFIHLNKPAIVSLIAIATAVGIAPVALIFDNPPLLIYAAICTTIVAAVKISRFETIATEAPSFTEFMLGGMAAIFPMALIGLVWYGWHWIILGGVWVFASIASLLGFEIQLNAELIAFYGSLIISSIMGVVLVPASVDNLAEQLYPKTAGVKSAFHELVTRTQRQLIVSALIVPLSVIGVVLAVAAFTTWWTTIGALLYMFWVTSRFSRMGEEVSTSESQIAVEAVRKLLEASGYQVYLYPRTGESEIDPLLIDLDLFAKGEERALAIEVRASSESSERLDPTITSGLLTAGWALESFFQEKNDEIYHRIDPMIVLVGKESHRMIKAIASMEEVQITEIPDLKVIKQILATDSQEELKKMANLYLGLPIKSEDLNHRKKNLTFQEERRSA